LTGTSWTTQQVQHCLTHPQTHVPCQQIEHTLAATSLLLPGSVRYQKAHPMLSKSTINKPAKLVSSCTKFESKIFQKSNLTEERKQNHKKETGIENTAKCIVAGQSVSRELGNTDTLVNNRWRSYLRQTLMCVVV